MVIEYLSALNLFFEQGLLGDKVRVFDPCGTTMQRMECGLNFYSNWMDELILKGCITAGYIKYKLYKQLLNIYIYAAILLQPCYLHNY